MLEPLVIDIPYKLALHSMTFLSVDEETEVATYPADDGIINSITNIETENDDDAEQLEVDVLKPSKREIIIGSETIHRGLQFSENVSDDIFQSLNKCESFYEKSATNFVQQDIQNYFYNKQSKCDIVCIYVLYMQLCMNT